MAKRYISVLANNVCHITTIYNPIRNPYWVLFRLLYLININLHIGPFIITYF
jgi:hypothetical protein